MSEYPDELDRLRALHSACSEYGIRWFYEEGFKEISYALIDLYKYYLDNPYFREQAKLKVNELVDELAGASDYEIAEIDPKYFDMKEPPETPTFIRYI